MSRSNEAPVSEVAELLNKIYVGFFFCLAITSSAKAIQFLVLEGGPADHALGWVRKLSVLAAVVLITWFVWKARSRRIGERRVFGGNEFIHLVFFKAMAISWFTTFVLLMLLEEFSRLLGIFIGGPSDTATLPAAFYLNVAVSIMLLVYCIAYFWLYRSDDGPESMS